MQTVSKDPLHGKTLQAILEFLVEKYGWERLGELIKIKCFQNKPTISSSLAFLRKTPWAREKVEDLYIANVPKPRVVREYPDLMDLN
ncbi:MAG: VF530 family protein [Candidatus Uhrbacteria bacterium]|jgi:uncharacterized protein (DUF2132 family)